MSKRRVLPVAVPAAIVIGIGIVATVQALRPPRGNPRVPEPAKPVDLGRYAGLWYEFARYDVGFERNCEGVTAEYAERPDGLIGVTNTARFGAPDGPVRRARARARVVEGSRNAKLKVAFFGPLFFGNYWVLDHADDYAWSIVGEGSGRYLWILTRDPTPGKVQRNALVARVGELGYDTGMLRFTRQPPG